VVFNGEIYNYRELKSALEAEGERFHSKSKLTPFEGMRVRGRPLWTIVRGRVVVRDGVFEGRPGWGRLVGPATP